MTRINTNSELTHNKAERAHRVLARVRQRQLDLAMRGQVEDSARYATRAHRVRKQAASQIQVSPCCAA